MRQRRKATENKRVYKKGKTLRYGQIVNGSAKRTTRNVRKKVRRNHLASLSDSDASGAFRRISRG